ncbi:hypothetical protein ABBQ38_006544 [Trebouxia sp. C0009 RCD-2024]
MYDKLMSKGVVVVAQRWCQSVLESSPDEKAMQFHVSSVASQRWLHRQAMYDKQMFIGVVVVGTMLLNNAHDSLGVLRQRPNYVDACSLKNLTREVAQDSLGPACQPAFTKDYLPAHTSLCGPPKLTASDPKPRSLACISGSSHGLFLHKAATATLWC